MNLQNEMRPRGEFVCAVEELRTFLQVPGQSFGEHHNLEILTRALQA